MRKNTSPRIKAKTSRRMIARRRISRRKIGITRARERVLPLNQAKNNPSLMLAASFTMALIVQKTVQSMRSLMPWLLKMVVRNPMKKFPAEWTPCNCWMHYVQEILLGFILCSSGDEQEWSWGYQGFETRTVHWTIKGRGSRFLRSNRGWTGVEPWWRHN